MISRFPLLLRYSSRLLSPRPISVCPFSMSDATHRQRSCCVITGASRGIGRAIARALADSAKESAAREGKAGGTLPSIHMVLIARSAESLRETSSLVEKSGGGAITTSCHELDLSDLDELPEKFQQILDPLSSETYSSCLLINNAGSVTPLGLASSMSGKSSMKELRSAVDLNFTSGIWVSSAFAKTFHNPATSDPTKSPIVRIVNISSLCALEPFPTMSIYCAGKAGRETFHKVLAKEYSNESKGSDGDDASVSNKTKKQTFKVLNYAPGPCDTQMVSDLVDCGDLDSGLHQFFATSKTEDKLVQPDDTAKKLVNILHLDMFESGSHIDYYDDV